MSLTQVEQHAIDGMLSKNMSVEDIKKELKKSKRSKVVENYIDSKKADVDVKGRVMRKLDKAGVRGNKAEDLYNKAIKRTDSQDPDVIYNHAMQSLGSQHLIKTRSEGGERHIVAMTEGASSRSDNKSSSKSNRKTRGSVFNVKTGKTE